MAAMIYLVENHQGSDYFVPVDCNNVHQVEEIEQQHDFVYGEVATNTAARRLVARRPYSAAFRQRLLRRIQAYFARQTQG
ncbi:hypothetical protein [Levilactobacillus spicheri]|nr:hypothetical protein [Levilactobacillus spicheri]GEO65796.1 hypothetical protein LSP04_02150 [Levilactobacillus spicheri]